MTRPRLLVCLGGRAGRHSELLQRLANASPPRGRRTSRRTSRGLRAQVGRGPAVAARPPRERHRHLLPSSAEPRPEPEPAGGSGRSRRAPRWRRPLRRAGPERGRLRRGRGADRWVAGGASAAAGAGADRPCAGGGADAEPPARRRRRRRREPRPRDKKGRGRRCALRVRPGAVRQNVPGGDRGRLSRRGSGRLCPAMSLLPPSLARSRPPSRRNPGRRGGTGTRGSPGLRGGSGAERSERGSRAARRSRRLILRHRPGQRRWQCRSQEQKLAEIVFCVREYEECTHD
ncbi:translation initiation factor IF-2-like [Serinus canaria]|uniref:translation initiation factor IF-2-like n=1 Tax=Serinus canaria TaxID=9135 RepID=UPI0021CC66AC|nr:translation initiation factor IF-2-like [Serinus canaria]